MSQPFVGEIRMFGGNFAPSGWFFCEGQLLSIAEYTTLFALIGTTYGGDGQQSFALPDLRGRIPIHQGNSHPIGQAAGSESVTLTTNQLPSHRHTLMASANPASNANTPADIMGASTTVAFYGSGAPSFNMANNAISTNSGGQPHNNLAPYLCVSFIISLFGIFPSQS